MPHTSDTKALPMIELDNHFMILYKLEHQTAREVVASDGVNLFCDLGHGNPIAYPESLEGHMALYANGQYFPVRKILTCQVAANEFMTAHPNTSFMATMDLGVTNSLPQHLIADNVPLVD
jgi:hypothetical protein